MTTNAPPFDPPNCTREEDDEMLAGYLAGLRGEATPDLASVALEHGYRVGRNDRARTADDDQKALAKRYLARQA